MPNFELGKYAIYIVPAYAITFVVIVIAIAETLLRTRRWKREAERLQALKDQTKKKG